MDSLIIVFMKIAMLFAAMLMMGMFYKSYRKEKKDITLMGYYARCKLYEHHIFIFFACAFFLLASLLEMLLLAGISFADFQSTNSIKYLLELLGIISLGFSAFKLVRSESGG